VLVVVHHLVIHNWWWWLELLSFLPFGVLGYFSSSVVLRLVVSSLSAGASRLTRLPLFPGLRPTVGPSVAPTTSPDPQRHPNCHPNSNPRPDPTVNPNSNTPPSFAPVTRTRPSEAPRHFTSVSLLSFVRWCLIQSSLCCSCSIVWWILSVNSWHLRSYFLLPITIPLVGIFLQPAPLLPRPHRRHLTTLSTSSVELSQWLLAPLVFCVLILLWVSFVQALPLASWISAALLGPVLCSLLGGCACVLWYWSVRAFDLVLDLPHSRPSRLSLLPCLYEGTWVIPPPIVVNGVPPHLAGTFVCHTQRPFHQSPIAPVNWVLLYFSALSVSVSFSLTYLNVTLPNFLYHLNPLLTRLPPPHLPSLPHPTSPLPSTLATTSMSCTVWSTLFILRWFSLFTA
jgi:hypothetical protein